MTRLMELPCKAIGEARRALEDARPSAVEVPHRARDFVHRTDWLQERFPDAKRPDIDGLVKLVERGAVEPHVWSLTPGRYVGVSQEEGDEDLDFEEALRAIHVDHKGLNEEARKLDARIDRNLKDLEL